ncbi:MAG: hypothetical protein ACOH10_05960 [Rhodoglobus sp.]|uniref:hypothetical protein n=1 Tax=Salinibacterium sp. G-O1 TaxID=3046208 RepID=UPI0024BA9D1D|nr:hypothetical protein [Salinibacterium sp. G-O1]MDJ0335773.1 hypothetical protein [Salinibacterium sp. G-O1]
MTDSVPIATSALEMPGYRLLFPQGWTRFGVDEDSERDVLVRTRAKIKRMARPDIDFALTASIKSAFRQLRSIDALAMYLPVDVAEDSVIPMSITASRLLDPLGLPLDDRITQVFRDFGGDFLGSDRKIVRWRRTIRNLDGLPGAINEQVNYAIPVAGTGRKLGLLLSASIIQDAQKTIDDETLEAIIALSDSIVATFTWVTGREQ